jgi:hypothetical protein
MHPVLEQARGPGWERPEDRARPVARGIPSWIDDVNRLADIICEDDKMARPSTIARSPIEILFHTWSPTELR